MNAQPPADARYTVELTRRGNHWTAELEGGDLVDVDLIPDTPVYGIDVTGTVDTTNGPGWALEQVGQTLDAREAQRLTAAHGFQELLDYVAPAPALDEDGPAYRLTRDAAGEHVDVVADVERVVEVVDDARGRTLSTGDVAEAAGFNTARALRALVEAARAGMIDRVDTGWTFVS